MTSYVPAVVKVVVKVAVPLLPTVPEPVIGVLPAAVSVTVKATDPAAHFVVHAATGDGGSESHGGEPATTGLPGR